MTDWAAIFVSIAGVVVAVVVAYATIPPQHRNPLVITVSVLVIVGVGIGLYGLTSAGRSDTTRGTPPISTTESPDRMDPPSFVSPTETPVPGPPKPGTYVINRPIFADSTWTLTLESIEITTEIIKVNILYENIGNSNHPYSCTETPDSLSRIFLSMEPSKTIYATDSFCASNPSFDNDLLPGETRRSWASFPNILTSGTQPFAVRWYPNRFGRGVEGIALQPQ